jgi:peptidoglycan hydrolase FlgJ
MATGNAAAVNFAADHGTPGVRPTAPQGANEPFRQFEAFVLQSFLENMLPDNVESVYGGGFAGGVWKSMMAEQLANQMARAGGIGIADRILKDHYARGEESVALTGAVCGNEKRDAETTNLTSQAILHEIQRRVGGALAGEAGLLTDRKQG